jgi:hypothetical protein
MWNVQQLLTSIFLPLLVHLHVLNMNPQEWLMANGQATLAYNQFVFNKRPNQAGLYASA